MIDRFGRALRAGLCIALLSMSSVGAAADASRWTESTRELFGAQTHLRLLRQVPPSAERRSRPHLVAIVWNYAGDADREQMPSPPEAARILQADTLLQTHIEQRGVGVLTVTMTGAFQHEWLYYTADPRALLAAFNALAGPLERWPVRLLTQPDPQWETYLVLLRRELARR